jgi:thiol-disulfide isomerase/thioredoxin
MPAKLIFLSFFLSVSLSILSQEGEYQRLERMVWANDQKNFFVRKIGVKKPVVHSSNPAVLSDKEKIWIYEIQDFQLLNSEIKKAGSGRLKVLVGFDRYQNIVIVADKNFNGRLNDDRVYKINMQKDYSSRQEFFDSIPLITIDSIKVGQDNEKFYKSIDLKIAASPLNREYFKNTREIKGIKDFYIDFYTLYAYSTSFMVDGQEYELLLVPDPLAESYFLLTEAAIKNAAFVVFKKNGSGKDSGKVFMPLRYLTDSLNPKPFSIENKLFALEGFLPKEQKIRFKETKPVENVAFFEPTAAFSITKNRQVSLDSFTRITVVEFSGSWCKPCKLVLPQLKQMHKKFSSKVDFLTIAKENDLASAKAYHKEAAIAWEMVYENLNCRQKPCLVSKHKVTSYPTFLLVDTKGAILFRQSGTSAIEALDRKIRELFN